MIGVPGNHDLKYPKTFSDNNTKFLQFQDIANTSMTNPEAIQLKFSASTPRMTTYSRRTELRFMP